MAKQNKKKYGTVNSKALYVRDGVGKEYEPIRALPIIYNGEKVQVLDTILGTDNEDWYHVLIHDEIYGYVKADFITII